MPLLFTFIFAFPLLFLSLSLWFPPLQIKLYFPACSGPFLPSIHAHTHTHTHQPFNPPLLFLPFQKSHPTSLYIFIKTLSLSPFLSKIGFLSGLLHYFFYHSLNSFWPTCGHYPLLVNYSSSALSFWGIWVFVISPLHLCLLSLCWLKKKPFLCFSGCSRKRITTKVGMFLWYGS